MTKSKKIILVAGARPNFMKIAPLWRAFQKYRNVRALLVHTGQHYDYNLSEQFFKDLELPKPDYFLKVGSGTHARQTASAMMSFERLCARESPDLVVVVGDVNSTLACSIVAKKCGSRVAHVEAGLRSNDREMPEELNRIVTDSISDFFLVTEPSGVKNLSREGKPREQIHMVGNTMIDSVVFGLNKIAQSDSRAFLANKRKGKNADYGVVTLHRPSNVDDKKQLMRIAGILNEVSKKIPLFFPVHPRTSKMLKRFSIRCAPSVHCLSPLGYLDFLSLYKDAKLVMTDSGGLQEECTFLRIPCLTMRENTERPITISKGTNILVGTDREKILEAVQQIITGTYKKGSIPPWWDGRAAERIAAILIKKL